MPAATMNRDYPLHDQARVFGIRHAMMLLAVFGVAGSSAVLASDGVLEINQTCAVKTGCFADDPAGFPVTITASGSYRLTSNLVVPDENTSGITISDDNVSIDLAGFEIRGPVVCSGSPLACEPNSGTGSGVEGSSDFVGMSVRNGSIRGMGSNGVSLSYQSEATNLRVRSNGLHGILTLDGSTVSGNTAHFNGGVGIVNFGSSTISANTAYLNGGAGFATGSGMTISGNTSTFNGGDGITSGAGSNVWGNSVRGNGGWGLALIAFGALTGYHGNVVSDNASGTVTGGVSTGNNLCNGSTTCP